MQIGQIHLAKADAAPFVPEVINFQNVFGKYTFPIVTELGQKSFVWEIKADNGRDCFHE